MCVLPSEFIVIQLSSLIYIYNEKRYFYIRFSFFNLSTMDSYWQMKVAPAMHGTVFPSETRKQNMVYCNLFFNFLWQI